MFFRNLILTCLVLFTINVNAQVNTYDQLPANLKNGLVAYYPFNNSVNDIGTNGYNGTIQSGSVPYVADRFGNASSAVQLGGGYITTSTSVFNFQFEQSFTISLWFTKESASDGGRLLSTECPEGNFRIAAFGGNGSFAVQYGSYIVDTINLNEWVHLVYTYDNRTEKVYINGQLTYEGIETITGSQNFCAPLTIGAKASSAFDRWIGKADDLAVYNRALTNAEVTQLYTVNSSGVIDSGITCSSVVFNPFQDTLTNTLDSVELDAGSGFANYLWNTGDTTQKIIVNASGLFHVSVTNNLNCSYTDSVLVSFINLSISASDTVICSNQEVQLTGSFVGIEANSGLNANLKWSKLIDGSQFVGAEVNFQHSIFDPYTSKLYSILKSNTVNRYYQFDLNTNQVTSLPSLSAPGELYAPAFDFTNNRIIATRSGRDAVYSLPLEGGSWTSIGTGGFDAESYGGAPFWNPVTSRFGYFGGYGFFAMKNWVWENNGSNGWLNVYANNNNCEPAKRNTQIARNADGKKLYFFSGQGSCDGNQFASSCSISQPWGTDVGVYCWLKDLWELDLTTYTFTNLLPVNHASILKEGSFAYDFDLGHFYNIGGYVPSPTWNPNIGSQVNFTNEVYRYKPGNNNGFELINVGGTPPPETLLNQYAGRTYYDSKYKRIIWARNDGVWALSSDSTSNSISYLWSTGDTSSTITVRPRETTTYTLTVNVGDTSYTKQFTVTVEANEVNFNPLSDTLSVCGDSVILDAGSGYATYSWSDGSTTQSISVTQSGYYNVSVTNETGCSASDSSLVSIVKARILQSDTTICKGTSLTLSIDSTSRVLQTGTSSLPSSLSAGLVAYYPFNGNANDESGNGNNGVVNGATLTSDRFGKQNSAYRFQNSGISVPMTSALHDLPLRTFSVWFNANGPQNGGRIYETTYRNGGIGLYNGNILDAWYGGSKECNVTDVNTGELNSWHHLVYVTNCDSGFGKVYLDGVLVKSRNGVASSAPQNWMNEFMRFGVGASNEFFNGSIDDILIYNRELTNTEIQALYTGKLTSNWSNGETSYSISVSPTQTTKYYVTVSDGITSCTDSITVSVSDIAAFDPLQDTLSVCGDSTILTVDSGFSSYLWNTGDTSSSIVARYSGIYSVTAFDNNGCSSTDSLYLSIIQSDIINSDTVICKNESLILTSKSINIGANGSGLPGSLSNGLAAYFPFNGNARDESNNGSDGTSYGATLTTDRFGNSNSAYNFDGINDYISTLNSSATDITGDITLSLWMNSKGREPYMGNFFQTLVTKRDVGNVTYEMDLYFPGTTTTYEFSAGKILPPSFQYIVYSQTLDYLNRWDHYAFVIKNDTTYLYRNGVLLQTPNGNVFPFRSQNANAGLTIGSAPGVQFFNGKLDDIILWNRGLSQNEIQQVQNLKNNIKLVWSTGDTTSSITVSPRETTTYTLTVTDGITTCTDQVTVTVSQVDTSLTSLDTTSICAGSSARLQAGVASSYVWLKNGVVINGASSRIYTATSAGDYRVVVTNVTGCSDTSAVVTITERPLPESGSISGGSVSICSGTNSTALSLSGAVGTIRWQSSLDSLVFTNINNATSNGYTATNLSATTYYRVIATNSCGNDTSAVIKITVNPKPVARFSVDNASQQLRANLFVFTNISTPATGVSYYWDFDNGFFSNLKNPSFSYRTAGTYQVKLKVTTDAGCVDSTSLSVVVREAPIALNDQFSTAHATLLSANVASNDTPSPDGGNVWSLVGTNGGSLGGTASMTSAGILTYTPRLGYAGIDTLTYQVCDSNGDCVQAKVSILVAAAPPPPPPPAAGNLYVAGTTCAQFNGRTASALTRLCYTVRTTPATRRNPAVTSVSAVTPTSFMYYVRVTAPSTSFTVNIGQVVDRAGFRLFTVNTGGSVASGDNCVRVASVTTPSAGQARVSISRATTGRTYIIGVRYNTSPLVGYVTNGTLTANYTFSAKIGTQTLANSTSSVTLYPNNCASAPASIISSRMPDSKEIKGNSNNTTNTSTKSLSITNLSLKVYPNPTSHYFNVVVEGGSPQTEGVLRVMNMVGQLIEEKKQVKPGQLIQIGHQYIDGMYLIEYIQGTDRAALKVNKH